MISVLFVFICLCIYVFLRFAFEMKTFCTFSFMSSLSIFPTQLNFITACSLFLVFFFSFLLLNIILFFFVKICFILWFFYFLPLSIEFIHFVRRRVVWKIMLFKRILKAFCWKICRIGVFNDFCIWKKKILKKKILIVCKMFVCWSEFEDKTFKDFRVFQWIIILKILFNVSYIYSISHEYFRFRESDPLFYVCIPKYIFANYWNNSFNLFNQYGKLNSIFSVYVSKSIYIRNHNHPSKITKQFIKML